MAVPLKLREGTLLLSSLLLVVHTVRGPLLLVAATSLQPLPLCHMGLSPVPFLCQVLIFEGHQSREIESSTLTVKTLPRGDPHRLGKDINLRRELSNQHSEAGCHSESQGLQPPQIKVQGSFFPSLLFLLPFPLPHSLHSFPLLFSSTKALHSS